MAHCIHTKRCLIQSLMWLNKQFPGTQAAQRSPNVENNEKRIKIQNYYDISAQTNCNQEVMFNHYQTAQNCRERRQVSCVGDALLQLGHRRRTWPGQLSRGQGLPSIHKVNHCGTQVMPNDSLSEENASSEQTKSFFLSDVNLM